LPASGVDELISIIDPENVRSIRVAEELGAVVREQIEFRGKPVDIYSVPRSKR
jgi:RimJ/RimL family protein N-acetyltransferase